MDPITKLTTAAQQAATAPSPVQGPRSPHCTPHTPPAEAPPAMPYPPPPPPPPTRTLSCTSCGMASCGTLFCCAYVLLLISVQHCTVPRLAAWCVADSLAVLFAAQERTGLPWIWAPGKRSSGMGSGGRKWGQGAGTRAGLPWTWAPGKRVGRVQGSAGRVRV